MVWIFNSTPIKRFCDVGSIQGPGQRRGFANAADVKAQFPYYSLQLICGRKASLSFGNAGLSD